MTVDPSFKFSIDAPVDSRTPLQRFRGVVKSIDPEERAGNTGSYMVAKVGITDLEVLESTEPYPFSSTSLDIPYNTRAATRWDVFARSIRNITGSNDINVLVGKTQEWAFAPCTLRGALRDETGAQIMENGRAKWGDVASNAWQVISVEGFDSPNGTGPNLMDEIVALVDGKTNEQFYKAFFNDSSLKKMNGYLEASNDATERTLLSALEKAGRISQNEKGVWESS